MEKQPRVSYILSQFPETHETFIVREIVEMARQGVHVEIFSLKKCRDKVIQREALPLKEKTHYPGLGPAVVSFFLLIYFLIFHPIRMGRIYFRLLKDNKNKPVYLLKTLGIVPAALWIGWKSKKLGIDHLHAHWATIPTETAWIAARAWGLSYSFTAHAWDIFLHPGNLCRLIEDATQVVTCTKFNKVYMRDRFGSSLERKITVVYHGLGFTKINPAREANSAPFQILAVGRLVEQKGFVYLIRALGILKQRGQRFRLHLIGTGPLQRALHAEAESVGVSDWVDFKGTVSQEDVFSLMRRSGVFVMPSVVAKNQDRDGIPNVILEAMAHRLPVVGTRVSGLPEVVRDGETGRLVDPESAEQLADAILFVKENPVAAAQMAENARKLVHAEFDIQKNVRKMRQILGLVGS